MIKCYNTLQTGRDTLQLTLEKLDITNLSDVEIKSLHQIFSDEIFIRFVLDRKKIEFINFIEEDDIVYVTKNAFNGEIVSLFIMNYMVVHGEYDIVYGTNPLYRGKSYTREGLILLQNHLLNDSKIETLFAVVEPENQKSKRLLNSVDFYSEHASNGSTLLRYDLVK